MKYKDYYNLNENDDKDDSRGDVEKGMKPGLTHFPHGRGFPNYTPKDNDLDDFKEVAHLNHIIDIPLEHSETDDEKRTKALYEYIKRRQPEFYNKFKPFIDSSFEHYGDSHGISDSFVTWFNFSINHPEHSNVPDALRGKVTAEDINIVKKISQIHVELYSLIHHRDDADNQLNYPLYVSLYDITRRLGGEEEGGWWYDHCELIDSIVIRTPSEKLKCAEKLYGRINNFDGKPVIFVEKRQGSQEKNEIPKYN